MRCWGGGGAAYPLDAEVARVGVNLAEGRHVEVLGEGRRVLRVVDCVLRRRDDNSEDALGVLVHSTTKQAEEREEEHQDSS